jgi:asparagine synthase (glutamine-hydrolysing)
MCGIAGIYAYHYAAAEVDRNELRLIRDHMTSRGPDGFGEWYSEDGHVGLAHRRLAILDLTERAAQPMTSVDGTLAITFNGEIYNYKDLRENLETLGYHFRTESDTEVLLHLYAEKGEAMVNDLRGMYAFGIWDHKRRGLLLVRDPYGIKPLYYADDGWTVRFGSQVKALLAGGKVSRTEDPAGWIGFGLFGSVPEPRTIYQQIRAVPAASTLWVSSVGPSDPKQFFSVAQEYCTAECTRERFDDQDAKLAIRQAMLDSVRHHLVSDVPVGAFLSSGIDSGTLVGLMRDAGQSDIQTVTLGFEEFRGTAADEVPLATKVAAHYGTRHTNRYVSVREFETDLPKILDAMDQPSIDGVNSWFISKAARELGLKVALSGLGADELLGGYPSFREIPRWVRTFGLPSRLPGLGTLAQLITQATARAFPELNPKAAGLVRLGGSFAGAYLLRRGLFMPWELASLFGQARTRLGLRRLKPLHYIEEFLAPLPKSGFGKISALESSLYMRNQLLRDTDWASMAHSIEVRVPFVDVWLLRRIASLSTRQPRLNKQVLASVPSLPLPSTIFQRPKTGFCTPLHFWLKETKLINKWQAIPALADDRCPWARRWAFEMFAS